mgnify:CR=1 FL=1
MKVFDAKSGQESSSFAAFDSSFSVGVRVASADVNQDGVMDIIAASGPGGQPLVRVFDGTLKVGKYAAPLQRIYDQRGPAAVAAAHAALMSQDPEYRQMVEGRP